MRKFLFILPVLMLASTLYADAAPKKGKKTKKSNATTVEIGKTLPAWSKGCFDIHFINSGRGECCFYIMPDGTTLLVDAGEVGPSKIEVMQRPNGNVRPYMVYANYIKHFLPKGAKAIDYSLATHLHIDHVGTVKVATETAPAGYHKTGMLALYDEVPYRYVFDSVYPDYEARNINSGIGKDWSIFMRWGKESKQFTPKQFIPGEEQIVMLNKPKKHKNFSIFNICADCRVWGLSKDGTKAQLRGKRSEGMTNSASCGFHVRYGDFDYIACGDLVGAPQNRVAYYFRDFIGEGKLEAFKCHHHLAGNSWSETMRRVKFEPQVALNHSFASNKPNVEKLMHVLPVVHGFYATNIHPDIEANPVVKENKLIDKITAYNGHIVLRVMPGGKSFYVYMLDDSDFQYRVKFVCGPYICK
ncbi:MAG: MBL fold metallo-hydrolase [Alistipes sp.]|nr:MBL fold metallo-hydrolase [Alistipes sp.]